MFDAIKNFLFDHISKIILTLILILVLFIVVPIAYAVCKGTATYSEGERTGIVTKVSHKGAFWKTLEGEMNLGGTQSDGNGSLVPTTWSFTASEANHAQLEAASRAGQRITIHYRQVYFQWPWNGSTDYIVVSVE